MTELDTLFAKEKKPIIPRILKIVTIFMLAYMMNTTISSMFTSSSVKKD